MKPEDDIFRFLNFTVQQHDEEEVPSGFALSIMGLAFMVSYYYL